MSSEPVMIQFLRAMNLLVRTGGSHISNDFTNCLIRHGIRDFLKGVGQNKFSLLANFVLIY